MNQPAPDLAAVRGDAAAQRRIISDAIRATLNAVDPREAIFRRVQCIGRFVTVDNRAIDLRTVERVFLIAIGKAAVPMADALVDLLGEDIGAGVLVTKHGHAAGAPFPANIQIIEAGHPVPDENSVAGARAIEHLLRDVRERDLVLCALSGGGSALAALPVEGVSLSDLQATTDRLLRSGATIHELNAVRKHLDRIKGGGLARMCRGAQTLALLLSDVIGDDLPIIASGPTAPDPSTFADALRVIDKFGLAAKLPPTVRAHLEAGRRGAVPDTPKPGDALFGSVHNLIIGSNRLAAEAAAKYAQAMGFNTLLLSTFVQGEAREVARVAAAIAREIAANERPVRRPACVIWGGETTVTVRGGGKGGRNQELALAAAFGIDGLSDTSIVALGTDGSDGPTDAAGAIATGETLARARGTHIDAEQYLAQNDSYNFFAALRSASAPSASLRGSSRDASYPDLIITGPTGTNVNDIMYLFLF
jgi:hydroxypyruvate reductase